MLRSAAVAGSWYPGSASELSLAVDAYLSQVPERKEPGRLLGLVAPHAGLVYSGSVAAHAYALLRGYRELAVILVGPSHRMAFEGVAVYPDGSFETPLGRIPVDASLASALMCHPVAHGRSEPHWQEHSLEMQLPFLQQVVPGVRIVPALMGSQGPAEVRALSAALAEVAREHPALLIASSDLSHYHPAAVANRLDAQVVSYVERLDSEGLLGLLAGFHGHACGGGPIAAVMAACVALGATRATALRYADSGDAGARDKERVVGYLAAAFWAEA